MLAADWYDSKHGLRARKAARWGYLRPPASGKLIWLACGSDAHGIALGAELTQAIRKKRLDVQLVLTVEREIPALQSVQTLTKSAWGYAPSDHPRAVERALTRLNPFALIMCGAPPRKNLSAALTTVQHRLAIACAAPQSPAAFEQAYPASEAQARSWPTESIGATVDLTSLLVEAQVDPNFRSLVNGSSPRHLWWLHSNEDGSLHGLAKRFRSVFGNDVLFVSGLAPKRIERSKRAAVKRISQWDRSVLGDGDIMLVDEPKWLPAVAAAVTATHLEAAPPRLLWQAMAGGAAISCNDQALLPKAHLGEAVAQIKSHEVLFYQWRAYRDNPILARSSADAARRKFWEERRLAARVNDELLERVFTW